MGWRGAGLGAAAAVAQVVEATGGELVGLFLVEGV